MKLIIEITENSYKYLKSKRNKSAAENVIANGLIYREQTTGEWIEETVPVALVGRGNRQCRCSNCGHGDIQAKTQEVPYCWFCGAKMKGGEENGNT